MPVTRTYVCKTNAVGKSRNGTENRRRIEAGSPALFQPVLAAAAHKKMRSLLKLTLILVTVHQCVQRALLAKT